jgi:hypothetical protein
MEKLRSNATCRPQHNRRGAKRLLCSDLIRLRWADESGRRYEEVAVLEDFSSTGASLFLGVPVPEGAPVTLHTSRGELPGVARYCLEAPNGYLAGMSFDLGAGEFVPEHLLDTSRLDFVD